MLFRLLRLQTAVRAHYTVYNLWCLFYSLGSWGYSFISCKWLTLAFSFWRVDKWRQHLVGHFQTNRVRDSAQIKYFVFNHNCFLFRPNSFSCFNSNSINYYSNLRAVIFASGGGYKVNSCVSLYTLSVFLLRRVMEVELVLNNVFYFHSLGADLILQSSFVAVDWLQLRFGQVGRILACFDQSFFALLKELPAGMGVRFVCSFAFATGEDKCIWLKWWLVDRDFGRQHILLQERFLLDDA